MVTTRNRMNLTVFKLSIAAFGFASIGVAVAAPTLFVPKAKIYSQTAATAFAPLASGPAIQLAKAGAGESEDCVRVTRMTGPDGKDYPTRGIVCSGNAD